MFWCLFVCLLAAVVVVVVVVLLLLLLLLLLLVLVLFLGGLGEGGVFQHSQGLQKPLPKSILVERGFDGQSFCTEVAQ